MLQKTVRRPSQAARRTGYVIAMLVNVALLFAIYSWPGWEAAPFLTAATPQVLGWVSASLIAGLAANVVYLVTDPPWLKSLGDLVITGIGLGAMIRVWQVFPFDFGDASFDWAFVFRLLLIVGIVGSVVGLAVQFVTLVRTGPWTRR